MIKTTKKLPSDYFLYETSYNSEVPVDQIFVHYFDGLPSRYNNSTKKYSQKLMDYFFKKGYKKEEINNINSKMVEMLFKDEE